jgi:D-erythro-7,8-dihydroneopterin triphosphate epimerase
MDRIHIRDLLVRCVIGVTDEERREKQDVMLNLQLHADLEAAARSDSFAETVDYRALKKEILAAVEGSRYQLLEAVAERVAGVCLAHPRVHRVEVTVDKPGALRFARSVGVTIVRDR